MGRTDSSPLDRRRARLAARGLLSLAALVAVLYWLFVALFLAVFKCDESCSGETLEHWRWNAQLVLAAVGVAASVGALTLGFTDRLTTYRVWLAVGVACAVAWLGWVLGSGSF